MIERMNQYQFWMDSVAGKQPQIVNEMPQPGFYRIRRGAIWVPVAVFLDKNAKLCFKFGREIVDRHVGIEQWPYYAAHAITEAEYRKVAEQGGNWSDADPVVAEMLTAPAKERAPDEDATLEFVEQIDTAERGISAYAKIEDDTSSAKAAGLRNMLLGIAGGADKARVAEKEPHLKASRDVDAKWQPIVKRAKAAADSLRAALEGWENTKREAAREAQRRAEQQALDHAKSIQDAAEAGKPLPPLIAPEPAPSNLPPPSAQIRPTHGKAAGISVYQHVVAIDAPQVFKAFEADPELIAFLTAKAQKAINAGITVPGVTTEERTRVR